MKFKFLLIISILALSCNSNDDSPTNQNLLVEDIWKKNYYETFNYYENGTSFSTVNDAYAGVETLKFDSSNQAYYDNPMWTELAEGAWQFEDDGQYLVTSLKRELDPSTGFGTVFYFPHNKIELLTAEQLVLVSDTTQWWSSSDGNSKVVTKYYFNH